MNEQGQNQNADRKVSEDQCNLTERERIPSITTLSLAKEPVIALPNNDAQRIWTKARDVAAAQLRSPNISPDANHALRHGGSFSVFGDKSGNSWGINTLDDAKKNVMMTMAQAILGGNSSESGNESVVSQVFWATLAKSPPTKDYNSYSYAPSVDYGSDLATYQDRINHPDPQASSRIVGALRITGAMEPRSYSFNPDTFQSKLDDVVKACLLMGSPETAIDMVLKVKALSGDAKNNPDLIKSVDRSIAGCLSRMELHFATASALYPDNRMDAALAKLDPRSVDGITIGVEEKAQMKNLVERLSKDAKARLQMTMQQERQKWLESQKPFRTDKLIDESAQKKLIERSTDRENLVRNVGEVSRQVAQQQCANEVLAEFINRAYPEFKINALVEGVVSPPQHRIGERPPHINSSYYLARSMVETPSTPSSPSWGNQRELSELGGDSADIARLLRNSDTVLKKIKDNPESIDKNALQEKLQRYVPALYFLSDMIQNDEVRAAMVQVFGKDLQAESVRKLADYIASDSHKPDQGDRENARRLGDAITVETAVQQKLLQVTIDAQIARMKSDAELAATRARTEYGAKLDAYNAQVTSLDQQIAAIQQKIDGAEAELGSRKAPRKNLIGWLRNHNPDELEAIRKQEEVVSGLNWQLTEAQKGLDALVKPTEPTQDQAAEKMRRLMPNTDAA